MRVAVQVHPGKGGGVPGSIAERVGKRVVVGFDFADLLILQSRRFANDSQIVQIAVGPEIPPSSLSLPCE